jgi:hypothetical protein
MAFYVLLVRLSHSDVTLFSLQQNDSLLDDEDEYDSRPSNHGARPSTTSLSGPVVEFPPPVGKEYILCMMINRPAPWSRPSPQRMYCVLTKPEFRLAGAFTTDTNFQ